MTPHLVRAHTHTGVASLAASAKPVEKRKPTASETGGCINKLVNNSESDCEDFLIAVVRTLVLYGASFDVIEKQLLRFAHHFNIKIILVRKPKSFTCILGDYRNKRRKIQIKDGRNRQPNLLGLIEAHNTFVAVIQDEIKVRQGVEELSALSTGKGTLSHPISHLVLAVILSASMTMGHLECSFWGAVYVAGATFVLCSLKLLCMKSSSFYALFFEIIVTVVLSLIAHDHHTRPLSGIAVDILPGFLYMCNMLRNTEKDGNVATEGYMKSMFAVIYTMLLKLGFPIISDFYLMSRLYMLVVLGRTMGEKVMKRRTILTVRTEKPSKAKKLLTETPTSTPAGQ